MTGDMPRLDEKALEALAALIYPSFDLTEEERETIRAFVEKKVSGYDPRRALRMWILKHPAVPSVSRICENRDWRMAATKAPAAGCTQQDVCGDGLHLTYASLCDAVDADAWRAELSIPAQPTHKTMLMLNVCDWKRRPAEGVFHLAGCDIDVQAGRGGVAYADFVDGIRDSEVFLSRNGIRTFGTLVLI